jgi:hypothetical protein
MSSKYLQNLNFAPKYFLQNSAENVPAETYKQSDSQEILRSILFQKWIIRLVFIKVTNFWLNIAKFSQRFFNRQIFAPNL